MSSRNRSSAHVLSNVGGQGKLKRLEANLINKGIRWYPHDISLADSVRPACVGAQVHI